MIFHSQSQNKIIIWLLIIDYFVKVLKHFVVIIISLSLSHIFLTLTLEDLALTILLFIDTLTQMSASHRDNTDRICYLRCLVVDSHFIASRRWGGDSQRTWPEQWHLDIFLNRRQTFTLSEPFYARPGYTMSFTVKSQFPGGFWFTKLNKPGLGTDCKLN